MCLLFIWNLYKVVILWLLPSHSVEPLNACWMPVVLPLLASKVRGSDCLRGPEKKGRNSAVSELLSHSVSGLLSLKQFHYLFLLFPLSIFDSFLFLTLRHKVDFYISHSKITQLNLFWVALWSYFNWDCCPQYTQNFLPFLHFTA